MISDLSSDKYSIDDITCFICAKKTCFLIRDKIEINIYFQIHV